MVNIRIEEIEKRFEEVFTPLWLVDKMFMTLSEVQEWAKNGLE